MTHIDETRERALHNAADDVEVAPPVDRLAELERRVDELEAHVESLCVADVETHGAGGHQLDDGDQEDDQAAAGAGEEATSQA